MGCLIASIPKIEIGGRIVTVQKIGKTGVFLKKRTPEIGTDGSKT
jgi:hypothetical protein